MLMMAKSILDIGRVETLEQIFIEIKKIEASDLQEISREMFDENTFSTLTYLPD